MYTPIDTSLGSKAARGRPEVPGLIGAWQVRRAQIEGSAAFRTFQERLHREVAIETGLLERLYVWDRGLTESLIEQGIDAAIIRGGTSLDTVSADRAKGLIEDQREALEGVFEFVKQARPLTEHWIRCLHERLTRGQSKVLARTSEGTLVELELLRGAYKERPNNPYRSDGTVAQEYCPPEQTSGEMARLLEGFLALQEDTSPDVLAAWLHHRFTQIHPFQDGNGRIARLLASAVFIRAGGFPLVLRSSERVRYITTLEAADSGDLGPLVELFGSLQVASLNRALGVEPDAPVSIDDALERVKEAYDAAASRAESEGSMGTLPRALMELARVKFEQVAGRVRVMLGGRAPNWLRGLNVDGVSYTRALSSAESNGIRSMAEAQAYAVDTARDVGRCILVLPGSVDGSKRVCFVVLAHSAKAAPSVTYFSALFNESNEQATALSNAPLAITPAHIEGDAVEAFEPWLDAAIARGLARWQAILGAE